MVSATDREAIGALAQFGPVTEQLLQCLANPAYVGWFSENDACRDAGLPVTQTQTIAQCLSAMNKLGFLETAKDFRWKVVCDRGRLSHLADLLGAIAHYQQHVHEDSTIARIVLTRPGQPSRLEEALTGRGFVAGRIEDTDEAFGDVATKAERRFVVMTPFLDSHGAKWLLSLFRKVPPGVSKTLLLRYLSFPAHPSYPLGFDEIRDQLLALGVSAHEYSHARQAGRGFETFHAKVLLADDDYAYVGSANMNRASLEYSMELGVLLRGRAARDVAHVIDAILSVRD